MKCKICKGERFVQVCGKTSDCCSLIHRPSGEEHNGYVPSGIGLGSDEDYIEMAFCLDCGQIHGKFPISDKRVLAAFKKTV